MVCDVHLVCPEPLRKWPIVFHVVPLVDKDTGLGFVELFDRQILTCRLVINWHIRNVVKIECNALKDIPTLKAEDLQGLGCRRIEIHIERDEPDRCRLLSVDKVLDGVRDVSNDQAGAWEQFASQQYLVHWVISGSPLIWVIPIVSTKVG